MNHERMLKMNFKTKAAALITALVMSLTFLVGASGCPDSGQPAEDFSLAPVGGGKPVTLSALKGKPTLVVFWATWCPPCRREIPVLKEIFVRYGTKLNMLGVAVNYRQTENDVVAFRTDQGLQYTILWDKENKASDHYCVSGIPTVVVVDPQGVIRYKGNQITDEVTSLLDKYTGKAT